MAMSLGKQIQISKGKLTKQILNAILAIKGCWDLSITGETKEANCWLLASSTPRLGDLLIVTNTMHFEVLLLEVLVYHEVDYTATMSEP
jgi:hypothetical protein